METRAKPMLLLLAAPGLAVAWAGPANGQEEGWITHHVEIAPDALRVVHGSMHAERGTSWLILREAGEEEERRVRFFHGPMRSAAFSRDGRRLASAAGNGTVRIHDGRTLDPLHEHAGHDGWVLAVALNGDGSLVASGGRDERLLVRHVATGEVAWEATLRGHPTAMRFLPAGAGLIVAHGGAITRFAPDGEDRRVLPEAAGLVDDLAVSGDGGWLAAVHRDGAVRVWDLRAESLAWTAEADAERAYAVDFAGDGEHLVTSGRSGVVRVWRRDGGALEAQHAVERAWIDVRWRGDAVTGADYDGRAHHWTPRAGEDPPAPLDPD